MKTLIVIGIILILAAITNPEKTQHVDAVKQRLLQSVDEDVIGKMNSGDNWEKAGAAIGFTLGIGLIDKMVESVVHTNSLVIFSLTTVKFQGESKIIGIGAFGNVWIFHEIDRSTLRHEE